MGKPHRFNRIFFVQDIFFRKTLITFTHITPPRETMSAPTSSLVNATSQTESGVLNVPKDSKSDSDTNGANDIVKNIADSADAEKMSLDDLKKMLGELTRQCDDTKSAIWKKEAAEKANQKRKRIFVISARKKYKVDEQLHTNEETKHTYDALCRKTDSASKEAMDLYEKQLEYERKIIALKSERDHAQSMVAAWAKRLKIVREQLGQMRDSAKETVISARKAKKIAAFRVSQYVKVRRALKHKVALTHNKAQLKRKEAELAKIKKLHEKNVSSENEAIAALKKHTAELEA